MWIPLRSGGSIEILDSSWFGCRNGGSHLVLDRKEVISYLGDEKKHVIFNICIAGDIRMYNIFPRRIMNGVREPLQMA